MYEIEITYNAREDLKALRKHEQAKALEAIETQLPYEPTVETKNRKRLEPNEVAEWELRVGRLRILYDVHEQIKVVSVEVIGYKIGNNLIVRGERMEL